MAARDRSIEQLMASLGKLPGIGEKTAERLAYHLVTVPESEALELAHAIETVRRQVRSCSRCFHLDAQDPCAICADPARDPTCILVVEDPREVARFEDIGWRGRYHVLQGRVSELEGIGLDDLTIGALLQRVRQDQPAEVCLATNPDLEGEGTARLLAERLLPLGCKVTRLARGLPAGSSIAQVSASILADAIEGPTAAHTVNEPLPIDPLLPEVAAAVRTRPSVLLMAPPGSGKTTRVPPALLSAFPSGEIVVLEPRRLAARAAASRVARELAGELGDLVGYQVRGDRRTSKRTRIRFVTEGVLVRQIVQDPFLEGVAAVCLDEFHERHLEGDLALAMLREVRDTVRQDLRLCVMSATLDPAPLRTFLGDVAELRAEGRLFDVRIVHEDRRDDSALDLRVRAAIDRALQETQGDVLVFLPGVGEIQRCADALHNLQRRTGVDVLPLHGRLDVREQDRAIVPGDRRKVVLSTNVAESSLTIAGVTAVIDSGLERQLRHDRGRGVDVLALERISLSSATQRTGRAGRTVAGVCYRLWTAGEERGMNARTIPDVQRVDLCGPALTVRAFAGRDPRQFGWFEAPPLPALAAADDLLRELGAIDGRSGGLTRVGHELLQMPLHPRLARVVVEGQRRGCPRAAATAATLLADVDELGRGGGTDLLVATDAFQQAEQRGFPEHLCRDAGIAPWQARQVATARDRLLGGDRRGDARDDEALARCLLAGFPDRVAVRATRDGREATMVGGRGLVLTAAADGHELVLALRLLETGRQQRSTANVVAPIEFSFLQDLGVDAVTTLVDGELDDAAGRVIAVRKTCYRDLALRSHRGGELPPDRAGALLLPLLTADPWRWLGEQKELRRLIARAQWLRERMPDLGLPALDDAAVATAAIACLSGGADLRPLRDGPVGDFLLMDWTAAQRQALARQAPDRIELPSGRSAIVDYAAPAGPTIAARLQEFFGLRSVGALAGGRVPVVLELLAPNHRPIQVTTDLASFWSNLYPTVRKELSRRYPRHSWPEDPLSARPEARPGKPRREG
ncbi:MAG: ATP-dependent helicase HrpB [Planctomycetes bacterium]|nr:ATP-dependent helicase HrpB [Planctomycetota bacterium]